MEKNMRKRLTILLLLLACALAVLPASGFEFVFGDLDQHGEILGGFLPSYLKAGAGYNGFSLIEDRTTQIDLLVGGGYSQRKVWQNPVTGAVEDNDPIIYDTVRIDWEVRFSQGLWASPVEGKDLLTLSAGYTGRYDMNIDSFKTGSVRANGGSFPIRTLDESIGPDYMGSVYPDLRGDRQHLGTAFTLTARVDLMDDQKMYANGFYTTVEFLWAPGVLNSALDGEADYYSADFNAVGAWTPVSFTEEGGIHLFSLTLIDRLNANWTDGNEVPVYAQSSVSLGRKVRGFTTWTYNTQFTMVNNFDIRLAGPAWHSIFPRINLFFDVGYGCGDYFNTDMGGSNFLMSTGIQMTVSFFDFIDLGYQIAYLFDGYNFVDGPDESITGKFTFFLDF